MEVRGDVLGGGWRLQSTSVLPSFVPTASAQYLSMLIIIIGMRLFRSKSNEALYYGCHNVLCLDGVAGDVRMHWSLHPPCHAHGERAAAPRKARCPRWRDRSQVAAMVYSYVFTSVYSLASFRTPSTSRPLSTSPAITCPPVRRPPTPVHRLHIDGEWRDGSTLSVTHHPSHHMQYPRHAPALSGLRVTPQHAFSCICSPMPLLRGFSSL